MFARSRWPNVLAAVLCASLALPLLGAGTPPITAPTLVLFPFREAEGLDPRYGSDYITKVAAALTAGGAIKIVMGGAATIPADYLHTTKADGGDFYLTGFVAPPANGQMAVIEQLVSGRSGVVVWSSTAHIAGDDDILEQGPILQNAIVSYTTRGYFAILNPTPKPVAAPPAPSRKNGISVPGGGGGATPKPPLDLPNEAYGFSSQPTAPPKQYASASHPSRFVVLTIAGKTVPPVIRDYAVSSLMIALQRHGQTVGLGDPATSQHPIFRGAEICAQTGAGYLVFGSVATKSSDATDGQDIWTEASLNVAVFDCGAQKFEQAPKPLVGAAFNWKSAVDHATNMAVTGYLLKVSALAHA